MTEYEDVVIGLEVHVQLQTETKLFCDCSTRFGADPNTSTCPVCMGLPGVLPVLNERAVEYAMRAALALNCEVQEQTKFDRKNYYYPDLPKAYQISQYDMPLAEDGELTVQSNGSREHVGIERVHLEEDAGKLIHSEFGRESYVDYNRAGTPLIEIVSRPDLKEPAAAENYLRKLKKRMEYLDVSDCNMEEGSLRCDANLSIRTKEGKLGVKTEVKNMNSFRGVRSALEFEARRQRKKINRGEPIQQGTRLWDEDEKETRAMRTKEEAHDYRYFPEPDLVPLRIPVDWTGQIQDQLPEMPESRIERFREQYDLDEEDARILTDTRSMADYFEAVVQDGANPVPAKNVMKTDLRRELNERQWDLDQVEMTPDQLAEVVKMMEEDLISSNVGSELITELVESGGDPRAIVEKRGLKQISGEDALGGIINEVIEENPDAVGDIRDGKEQAIGFLVGQVMQKSQGQANPKQAKEMLREAILQSQ